MNWRDWISSIYESRIPQPGIATKPTFYPAASAQHLAKAEVDLNASFPKSRRSLLLESNGVMEKIAINKGEYHNCMWLVWGIAEIVEQNLFYRKQTEEGIYNRDFKNMIIFTGAGVDGILFGFPVMEDCICKPEVIVWYPISDESTLLAQSLQDFLKGWLMDTIII
jgi:hypothetical protein